MEIQTLAMATPSSAPLPLGAFHELLVATLPRLRQQALALTRNRADADDLVQAAVANALAARNSFVASTNFRAWMSRILRNRFFSNLRARRETVAIEDAPAFRLACSGGQEQHIEMQELHRNLARLRPDHRLVLMMIAVQGLSYEEASAELGVAVGTLKCRVFRARKQLQAWMLGAEPPAATTPSRVPAPAARLAAAMPPSASIRETA
jgi:RNA polymerase sigma-70 factor (ECF subfamily)